MRRLLHKHIQPKLIWPALLVALVSVIMLANYQSGTWLSGWDNLHPEFNWGLNFTRAMTAGWQQYQSLGLPAAMAHASDLPRMIMIFLLDVVLPSHLLRYAGMYIYLLVGTLGVYAFMQWLLQKLLVVNPKFNINQGQLRVISFLTAAFYLLNLGTLQQFYSPIEMFPTQWAMLPLLLLCTIRYIEKPDRRNLVKLILLNLLASPMAYTPTLFVIYFGFITLILMGFWIQHTYRARSRAALRTALTVLGVVVLVNSYWLLSFGYFVASGGSQTVVEAQMNRIASEDSFAMNRARGTALDVLELKGFWFDNIDYKAESGEFGYMMDEWLAHQSRSLVQGVGVALGVVVMAGVAASFVLKVPYRFTLLAATVVCVFLLLNSNPPLGFVFEWLREISPMFKEAMRFPFTKVSPVATLLYTIYFGVGITALVRIGNRVSWRMNWSWPALAVFLPMMIVWMLPAFYGNFIYSELKVEIPSEYFQMFDWLKAQPVGGRVANLPQHNFWAWRYHDWGYRGSGFIWYGIKQPVLDRAFDTWSNYSEQYYNELVQAVYDADLPAIHAVFQKYQVRYVLYDRSILLPEKQRNFYEDSLLPALTKANWVTDNQRFGDDLVVLEVAGTFDPIQVEPATAASPLKIDLQQDLQLLPGSSKWQWKTQVAMGELEIPSTVSAVVEVKQTKNRLELSSVLPQIAQGDQVLYPTKVPKTSFQLDEGSHLVVQNQQVVNPAKGGYLILEDDLREALLFSSKDRIKQSLSPIWQRLEKATCSSNLPQGSKYSKQNISDGVKYTAQSATSCTFFRLPSNSDQPVLMQLDLEYASDAHAKPQICILDGNTNRCLNEPDQINLPAGTPGFQKLRYSFEVPAGVARDLWLGITLNASKSSELQDLSVRNMQVNIWQNPDILRLPERKQAASRIQLQDGELEITYPQVLSYSLNLKASNRVEPTNCAQFGGSVERVYQADSVVYQATNADSCDLFSATQFNFSHDLIMQVQYQNKVGRAPRICLSNPYFDRCFWDKYLPSSSGESMVNYLVPSQKLAGDWLDIAITNLSRGNFPVENKLQAINFYYLPALTLRHPELVEGEGERGQVSTKLALPFGYVTEVNGSGVLQLNEQTSPGWAALNVSSAQLLSRVENGSWSNQWLAPAGSSLIVIFYWPQFLQYLGFFLMLISLGTLMKTRRREER